MSANTTFRAGSMVGSVVPTDPQALTTAHDTSSLSANPIAHDIADLFLEVNAHYPPIFILTLNVVVWYITF